MFGPALAALAAAGAMMIFIGLMVYNTNDAPKIKYIGLGVFALGVLHALPGLAALWLKAILG